MKIELLLYGGIENEKYLYQECKTAGFMIYEFLCDYVIEEGE